MAKRFKLRISRVITSFQSCRSKDPSNLPEDPVPSFSKLSDIPVTKQPHRSSFKHHVSSALSSVGCGCTSKYGTRDHHTESLSQRFQWKEEDEWHIIAKVYEETPRQKIYNSSVSGGSDDDFLALPLPPATEKKKRRTKKKKQFTKTRLSTSSADTDSGLFSEEKENEETETLVSSSKSFSTDSSTDFNPQLETIRETPITRRHRKRSSKSKRRMCRPSVSSPECESPARLSVFKKLLPPCAVEGKVKESFAVVKKSEDPFEDFKRSMAEMILEKQMFEERDLEELLQCFLSLNSRQHHGMIVDAFSEIWDTMFCTASATTSTHRRLSKPC